MLREIASFKVKFKEVEERKYSSFVEGGDEPQRDTVYMFAGFNKKKYRRSD